ncbi:unnamed protein product [Boreogadus saida]
MKTKRGRASEKCRKKAGRSSTFDSEVLRPRIEEHTISIFLYFPSNKNKPFITTGRELMLWEAATQLEPQTQPPLDPSELVPRMCVLARCEAGYGFNLHSERARPGQYIRSLDAGSPAEHAGLRPQDRLIEGGAKPGKQQQCPRGGAQYGKASNRKGRRSGGIRR